MEPMCTIGWSIVIVLRIFGIWPDARCVLFRRSFWIISLAIVLILQYRYIVSHFHTIDLPDLMDGLSECMFYTIVSLKLIIFWFNQRQLKEKLNAARRTLNKILTTIEMDWKGSLDLEAHATTSNAYLSHRISNSMISFQTMSVVFYCAMVFIAGVVDDGEITGEIERPLIVKMDLPFDTSKRFVYESIMLTQFLHMLPCAFVTGMLNALLIALILHVGDEIDILRGRLAKIFPQEDERSSKVVAVKDIIRKHQKIITLSQNIEYLYSYVAMELFLLDTIIMCCLGFILVVSFGTPDAWIIIMRTFMFYFIMSLEAFTFCFAGEYLSTKSQTIGEAAYNSPWYKVDHKDNQFVLFLIMRSQNQLTLSIGRIMDLSLERFSGFMKASGSYISVLLAMY